MAKWLSLAIGGIAGTFARYFLGGLMQQLFGSAFPYGTLIVNLTGCFLIGLFVVLAEEKLMIGPDMKILLMVGFCGAFTTFSTFMLETGNLVRDGEILKSWIYVILSVTAGFLIFRAGVFLGQRLF